MKGKMAFLFPGQGSQYIGMGKDFLDQLPDGRELYQVAEKVTGVPVTRLCLEGPMEELTKTSNLQPCLTAVDMLCCKAVLNHGIKPHAVAGHSLGEYPALAAASVLSSEECFRLIKERGRLMDEAAMANPGGMAAVIGMERSELEKLVDRACGPGRVLAIANHNSRQQIVVTGHKPAVKELCKLVKETGKKAIPLKVSGAYHSPLMNDAAKAFADIVERTELHDASLPVYSNVTAEPETSASKIRQLMSQQICSPVRWYEIINNMYRDGIRIFIELGPKKVLTNLSKNCVNADDVEFFNVEKPDDLSGIFLT